MPPCRYWLLLLDAEERKCSTNLRKPHRRFNIDLIILSSFVKHFLS